jgi:hypothetical protein
MPPYRTPAAIPADIEWKLGALTVLRRVVLPSDFRDELESVETRARDGASAEWSELAVLCERALTESAQRLAPPEDVVTSLLHADDDPRRLQLFIAIPAAVPDVEVVGAEDGFVALGRAELARWLLDSDLDGALRAIAEIEPRIAVGDGDACISWMSSGEEPDPALPEVSRILRRVRDRLVVE